MKKNIYLAGGCFWGLEKFLQNLDGVIETTVGYANGKTENPTYQQVCYENTGHAETVKVVYENKYLSLKYLLELFFSVINPTLINRQGNDVGTQYRTGIYFEDEEDKKIILEVINEIQKKYSDEIVTEVKFLQNFYNAEDYHQDYLIKNPSGYCHISPIKFDIAKKIIVDPYLYEKNKNENISEEEYNIAYNNATERAFSNKLWNFFEDGLYVDKISGEPLFTSKDKFTCSCGWASFTKPIDEKVIKYLRDSSHGMERTEVRSRVSNIHLGHVFNDGPVDKGGARYCINGSILKFIPLDKMEEEGYGKYIKYIR